MALRGYNIKKELLNMGSCSWKRRIQTDRPVICSSYTLWVKELVESCLIGSVDVYV